MLNGAWGDGGDVEEVDEKAEEVEKCAFADYA